MRLHLLRKMWSLCRNKEGSALVEATVVVPVLFTLTFGVYEFSWVFYTHQLVSAGVRDAARYAAKALDPCDATIQTDAKNLATTGTIDGSGVSRIRKWDGSQYVDYWTASSVSVSCSSVDNSAGTYRGGTTITIVHVTTSFTDNSLGFFPYLGLTVPTISVTHSERAIMDFPNPS